MDTFENERRPLLPPAASNGEPKFLAEQNIDTDSTPEVYVYKRRWYILVLFSMLGFLQNAVWNTWGPISASSESAFGWTDQTIALMNNWGPIAYIVAIVPVTWLMDVKGLRWAVLISAVCVTIGAGLRCITSSTPAVTYLMHAGQGIADIGGIVSMGGGPLLSMTWFPISQRTTATASITTINNVGLALSFIAGPYLVPDVPSHFNSSQGHEVKTIKSGIMRLMYYEFGLSVILMILFIVYFPAKPKQPPSLSASMKRLDYKEGLKLLVRKRQFWIIGLLYAVPGGLYSGWISVLDVIMQPFDVSQSSAGWMGFYCLVAGNILSVIVSIFADVFKRRLKLIIFVLYSFATACFIVFALVFLKVIPYSLPLLYFCAIFGGMTITGTSPLFFELSCEATYPVAEGITNGLLTLLSNIQTLLFYFILMNRNAGKDWVNWSLLASIAGSLPILLLFREDYTRLEIDTSERRPSTAVGGLLVENGATLNANEYRTHHDLAA